ncbi:hypothetical protein XH79_12840 [Bradyrhizobium sp. CCBAU 45389]|nr:hypothetical protein [Bradyrhizobium sp. CCBAU 45389]
MVWFQSKQYRAEGPGLAPKFLDSVSPIIVEICHNSSAEGLFPRCETQAVAFLPQVLQGYGVFLAREVRTVDSAPQ